MMTMTRAINVEFEGGEGRGGATRRKGGERERQGSERETEMERSGSKDSTKDLHRNNSFAFVMIGLSREEVRYIK